MSPFTTDTLFEDGLIIRQPKNGYRFSIDPVLLAHHARPNPSDRILDLGTGCGIIPLILGYRTPGVHVRGIEIQPELAELAQHNVSENGMAGHIEIICRDIRKMAAPRSFDLVLTNPPYREVSAGRISPDSQRAIARCELSITLEGLLGRAAVQLAPSGRFLIIYPARRAADLLYRMRKADLAPRMIRFIHGKPGVCAKLLIVEGIKGGNPDLTVAAPLILHDSTGNGYSEEVRKLFLPEP